MDTTDCSREILEVVPLVMRAIRAEMRAHRGAELTIPQFRALLFISRTPGTSLVQLAGHLGLTPATTSKMVDGLVVAGLINRGDSASDRRRLTLSLSSVGQGRLNHARKATQSMLDQRIAGLDAGQEKTIHDALQILKTAFSLSNEMDRS